MSCAHCPCPGACLGWPAFCEWASTGDPVLLAHVRARSTAGPAPRADAGGRPGVAESLALTRAMAACAYRATGPGCGCGGARCALRAGAIVSHRDCFSCLETYDRPETAGAEMNRS